MSSPSVFPKPSLPLKSTEQRIQDFKQDHKQAILQKKQGILRDREHFPDNPDNPNNPNNPNKPKKLRKLRKQNKENRPSKEEQANQKRVPRSHKREKAVEEEGKDNKEGTKYRRLRKSMFRLPAKPKSPEEITAQVTAKCLHAALHPVDPGSPLPRRKIQTPRIEKPLMEHWELPKPIREGDMGSMIAKLYKTKKKHGSREDLISRLERDKSMFFPDPASDEPNHTRFNEISIECDRKAHDQRVASSILESRVQQRSPPTTPSLEAIVPSSYPTTLRV